MTRFEIELREWEPGNGSPFQDEDLGNKNKDRTFYFTGTHEEAKKELERLKKDSANCCRWNLKEDKQKYLVIMSGPSCVGKGPALSAVKRFYPEIKFKEIPVIKSLESRPKGLRDDDDPNYFMKSADIEHLEKNYVTWQCRGSFQAVKLEDVLYSNEPMNYLEIYRETDAKVRDKVSSKNIKVLPIFMSPLDETELKNAARAGINLKSYICGIMMSKLIQRSEFNGKDLYSYEIIDDNLKRALDAYSEIRSGTLFSKVLVNHDGEGHPNWNRLKDGSFICKPLGEAWNIVETLADVLRTGKERGQQPWKQGYF